LSTLATQPNRELSWKQEVNRRIAAHKSRQATNDAHPVSPAEAPQGEKSRAALAAARVAARYAKAPSYSQMLAEEARAAVRAAEAASQAALKAQAAAESVLAGLETASVDSPEAQHHQHPAAGPGLHPQQTTFFDPFLEVERPVTAVPRTDRSADALPVAAAAQGLEVRWDPDMPVRRAEPAAARAPRRQDRFTPEIDEWREPLANYGEPETVEPAQPIHANLIEFPRELVATRKARPRIAEGPLVPEGGQTGQLSIFEVDPCAISIEPEPADIAVEQASSGWSRIRLDPEPAPRPEPISATEPAARTIPLHPAPFGLRVMAALVDSGLVAGLLVAAALVASENIDTTPSMKSMELIALLAMFFLGALYQIFFFSLAQSTPGMRYAGIRLSTFDDEMPTRAQLRRRLCALLLSLLPMGLGLVWAIFDEDHLSWHDRISRTYQR
jgi:uncharacterized RDD family membrane protein YckC